MGVDGAEEGDAAAVLVWIEGGSVVWKGEEKGGRTLIEEAVEFELLDPFGDCCGCHCGFFLHAFLSLSLFVLLASS